MFPAAVYSCFASANQLSYRSWILPLNGLFQTTSGMIPVSTLELVKLLTKLLNIVSQMRLTRVPR